MEDHIPIRPDRSLLSGRHTSEWSLWNLVFHENNSNFFGQAASSNLQREIAKETEEYIELQKQLLEKRVELGRIDLDLETVEALKKLVRENTFVLEEMNKMGEDQHGKNIFSIFN